MSEEEPPFADKLTEKYLTALHGATKKKLSEEMLHHRLEAVVALELMRRVPLEVRVHIMTVLTYVSSLHERLPPDAGVETIAEMRKLLLPESSDSLAKHLVEDRIVQTAMAAAERNFEKVAAKLAEQKQAQVIPFPPKR